MTGKVYLVGAGPGDPDLITVKGRRLLQSAGAVLYDHLANPALLALAPASAERIYVGKKRSDHAFTQSEIIDLIIDAARRGLDVVRLKGGDPFIFGRGGEEVEGLVDAGIEYEVVPGVTSPLGIAAYTGVPLTHREHTSVVTFVTGHDVSGIDWNKTGVSETLVVFMGLHHLSEIVEKLLAAGRPADTPAMAVRWGTRPDQKIVRGTLAELPRLTADAKLAPPTTVVIGEVVGLHDKLDWFGKRALSGQRIVVTRALAQAADLAQPLRDLGADAIELPVIELAPLEDYSGLDNAIRQLECYDWVIFTSTNAVEHFFRRLRACDRDARAVRGRICSIGPATTAALLDASLRPDLVPDEAVSEDVAAAFAAYEMNGKRVLLPRAAAAREVIPQTLTAMGAQVDIADAYRNIIPADAAKWVAECLASGRKLDWITFTSGSTVKNWLSIAGRESLSGVQIASIGPATSEVVRKHGLTVSAEADPHTIPGLIDAIVRMQR